jgi:hypothetical protein
MATQTARYATQAMVRQHLPRVLVLLIALSPSAPGRAEILESVTEDLSTARGREADRSKGGPSHNKLTSTTSPVRHGKAAFKHWVSNRGERSELAMRRTEIGGT